MPMIFNSRVTGETGSRRPVSYLAALVATGLFATPTWALESREVRTVVTVLEQLASETGSDVFYDEEAADEWYQVDDETSRFIPAAGFSRVSWKEAFDQTMTGFIASIPKAELDQMIETFASRIGEIAQMTPEQKEEAMTALREHMGKFDEIRQRGEPYQHVVAPYASRLRKLVF